MRDLIRGIVFDAHGTLIEYDEDRALAYFAQIGDDQRLGVEPTDFWKAWLAVGEEFAKEQGRGWDQLDGPLPPLEPFRVTWPIQFERAFARLNIRGDATAASDYLRHRFATSPLYDDVLPALERIRGYPLVLTVLSNADHDFLLEPLERHALEFHAVDSSETARAYKPHRRAFEHAAERAGLPMAELLYVGDSPTADVGGARNAGMRVAWINRRRVTPPETMPKPDVEVADLLELAQLLDG